MVDNVQLTIYIEPALLGDHATANLFPQQGQTFKLFRKVNGMFNTVFQTRETKHMLAHNTFRWIESFKIAAIENIDAADDSSTTVRDIKPGQVCDWTNPALTQPARDMPPAGAPPPGAAFPQGTFGTIGMPDTFRNVIYLSLPVSGAAEAAYKPIYTDPKEAGDKKRMYAVEDKFQVVWEDNELISGGMVSKFSTVGFEFAIPAGASHYCISWGRDVRQTNFAGQPPPWWEYGTLDPSEHSPSKASSHQKP